MVKLITSTSELQSLRSQEKRTVGFVPTMGNLHAGHISLLERALKESEVVYFSIFVNPKQFGPHEDFNRYPRTLEQDLNLIRECASRFSKVDVIVYAPRESQEVFPAESEQNISVLGPGHILEGQIRPGHFDGVATVVYRLFDLVKPHLAYFGLKDYQQYLVIKQMVQDLLLPIKIIGMPIVREPSGLALSSRNQYLSDEHRKTALILNNTLNEVEKILSHSHHNFSPARAYIDQVLQDKNWNYLEMRDAETLSADVANSKRVVLLGVYQLGSTRLLDNRIVEIR